MAPSVWDAVCYGRVHADAWVGEGCSVPEAVLLGIKAMYDFAYGEVRGSVVNRGGRGTTFGTSNVEVSSVSVVPDSGWFELLSVVAGSGLSDVQVRMLVLYGLGWSRGEAAVLCGLSVRSGQRRFAEALDVLRKELAV